MSFSLSNMGRAECQSLTSGWKKNPDPSVTGCLQMSGHPPSIPGQDQSSIAAGRPKVTGCALST